jgi:hypothetical protein
MSRIEPPSLAAWLLQHCLARKDNEALAGDLLEELRAGRSATWYWRQVVSAIAIESQAKIVDLCLATLYAALWSMMVPTWLLIVSNFEGHFNLDQRFLRMEWPWSVVCDLGFLLSANLLFVWSGIALYLFPHAPKKFKARSLSQGMFASIPVILVMWAALIILPKMFLQSRAGNPFAAEPVSSSAITHVNPIKVERIPPQATWTARYGERASNSPGNASGALGAFADLGKTAVLARLPFSLVVLCALWKAKPSDKDQDDRIAI